VLAAACSSPTQQSASSVVDVAGEGSVLFVAQNAIPNSFMDALFVGRVVADGDGCLRLDGPDPATVVWPFRFSLDGQGRVLDSLGVEIGRIGESFSLGGGEVVLHDGIAMSQADKQLAEASCPGRFWIVGDVL
jgi:hypothetical protein